MIATDNLPDIKPYFNSESDIYEELPYDEEQETYDE